ncbi:putative E3 ubiquitin ligase complex SCF subunit sconB [Acropora cervicornis]|uniref:E3 ubiquitin ligase complex SCF subunit sconB n=1 Tax=Acropora cervicornis TaxID=6130 RepID=A0AAD9QUC4_ACRCE|nr:putative E3 ubiquitin ligase complex SCF subunit sconB [Acropora cervicornis]
MADEERPVVFFPILKNTGIKKGKNNTRLGVKKIHKPLLLPSLDLNAVDVQLVSSLFSHKQICKKVCEWFVGWRSWQQKILLCGVSEKCSRDQLKALVTTLEPVFHRDFTVRLKGTYPTTFIRPAVVKSATAPSFSADTLANTLQPNLSEEVYEKYFPIAEETESFQRNEWNGLLQNFSDANAGLTINGTNSTITVDKDPGSISRNGGITTVFAYSEKQSLDNEEVRGHEHAPTILRRVSTPHFFSEFNHRQLGPMKSAPRIGDTCRLYGHAPVTFKHDKWWEGHKGARLIKPRRSKLSNHFKSQINQIYQWLDGWQIHERVDLLSEVLKCCDEDCLNFFAQCLGQRLRDRTDINCVPDRVLLKIFSNLDVQSLCRSSQVCHRWRFLANDIELWKKKIAAMGAKEGVKNLPRKITFLGRGQAVDWKQAYKELLMYYRELAEAKLAEQEKSELPLKTTEKDDCKTVITEVADIPPKHSLENIGPVQSAVTTEQRENAEDFVASDLDGNDLTGGNLKLLTRSLQALTQEDRPDELEVALDVRPALVQASNLLEEDGLPKKQRFRYLSLAVQGVFAVRRVRRVWDVRSGRSVHKLKGHKGGVRCLQFDDEKIVSGSWDMTVMVELPDHMTVRFESGVRTRGNVKKLLMDMKRPVNDEIAGAVTSLQLTEEFLVSGSTDRTLKLWSLETRQCLETFVLGYLVLSGSADGMILFWDLETGECQVGIQAHEGPVYSLDYNGHQHFFSSGG